MTTVSLGCIAMVVCHTQVAGWRALKASAIPCLAWWGIRLLNIYPSIDTQVCFDSVKQFEIFAKEQKEIVIACISMDLPFALNRVVQGEDLQNILFLSDFRNRHFGELFGLTIVDGPLAGLLARAVIVLDANHKVVYSELVHDVSTPPDYQAAMEHLQRLL